MTNTKNRTLVYVVAAMFSALLLVVLHLSTAFWAIPEILENNDLWKGLFPNTSLFINHSLSLLLIALTLACLCAVAKGLLHPAWVILAGSAVLILLSFAGWTVLYSW